MKICLEQSAESCEKLHLADSEHVKHRVLLLDELCLSSDEFLQQFPPERKVLQAEVERMCNQFLQIYELRPVQLWKYMGLVVIQF